jgi:hypothetical protein
MQVASRGANVLPSVVVKALEQVAVLHVGKAVLNLRPAP